MSSQYDAAVIGLGGIGSAALAHLSGRGISAIGLEQYERLHDRGSSSGETRIIRKAYFEDPAYVPLLQRAYELWHQLEAKTGQKILDLVGILMVGTPESTGIAGTRESAKRWNLPLDVYDADQIARHFPGTRPRPDEIGLLEHDAGIVFPEAGIGAHLDTAQANGATIRFQSRVTSWRRVDGMHRLTLDDDSEIEARRVAIAPGMWTSLLADLELPLRVQRNVQIWFEPQSPQFDRGIFPTYFLERLELPAPLYGFPAIGGSIKAALHGFGDPVSDPDRPDRRIRDRDVTIVADALDEWMQGAAGAYARGKVCMYTLTPDNNFILDLLPNDPTIAIAAGFCGHGYKFAPVAGEVVADLLLEGGTKFDIDFLSMKRFP